MENLSSTDFDSPSKTPLFLGIAGVIVGVTGLLIGWLGFTKASRLEAQLADFSSFSASIADVETKAEENAQRITAMTRMSSEMQRLSQDVNTALGTLRADIDRNKKDVRSVEFKAGTALKKLETLEKREVKAAAVPAPRSTRPAASSSPSPSGGKTVASTEGETYRIQKGDLLGQVAAKFKVSLADLLDANPGIDPRRMAIGQEIVIPASK